MAIALNNPALSIIVPNYNKEAYLSDCLDSILHQTFSDYEIVVADDCSTDGSGKIISDYQKRYPAIIRPVYNKKNLGVATNRHNAILKARGQYLTTIDGDDFFYSAHKLAKEMALIRQFLSKYNEDIIAFSNTVDVTEDKVFVRRRGDKLGIRQGNILNDIMMRNCEIPLDFIMKKEMYFDAGGYNTKFAIYEDWDLKIRLAARYRFFFTEEDGTAYRHHGFGLSSSDYISHAYWQWNVFWANIGQIQFKDRHLIILHFLKRLSVFLIKGFVNKRPKLRMLERKIRYG